MAPAYRKKSIAHRFSMRINHRVDRDKASTNSITRNKTNNYHIINHKTKVKWIAVIKSF